MNITSDHGFLKENASYIIDNVFRDNMLEFNKIN